MDIINQVSFFFIQGLNPLLIISLAQIQTPVGLLWQPSILTYHAHHFQAVVKGPVFFT